MMAIVEDCGFMGIGSRVGVGQVSPVRLVCIGRWEVGSRSFQGQPIILGGAYRTGTEAMQRAAWGGLDVALIDDRLPDLDTFDCLRRINQLAPQVRVVVACEGLQEASAMLWLVAGAAGCVPKSISMGDLARACLLAFHAGVYLPPTLLRKAVSTIQRLRLVSRLGGHLTPREMDTLLGVMLGQSNKDIAARLGVEVGTVKTHIHRLLLKFDAPGRHELVGKCASAVATQ
jgi:DNA-binding NarL/FixJ family response regulator